MHFLSYSFACKNKNKSCWSHLHLYNLKYCRIQCIRHVEISQNSPLSNHKSTFYFKLAKYKRSDRNPMITQQHFAETRLDKLGYSSMHICSKDEDRVASAADSKLIIPVFQLPVLFFMGKAKAIYQLLSNLLLHTINPYSEHAFISIHVSWLLGGKLFLYGILVQ